jgi:hypothetical protein
VNEHPSVRGLPEDVADGAWADMAAADRASGAAGPPSDEATDDIDTEAVRTFRQAAGANRSHDSAHCGGTGSLCAVCTTAGLRAALASAEQRARTQALEEAIRLAEARANHYDCESEPDCWAIADAIRSLLLGASPEGRGSATPQETGHD